MIDLSWSDESSQQEGNNQEPTCKLTRRQLVRDPDPDLTRKLFVLEDISGDQPVTVEPTFGKRRARNVEMDEYDDKVKNEDEGETSLLSAGLLFTCKSIYEETLLQFYARTQFFFASCDSVLRFLETVPPQTKAAIRHIELRRAIIGRSWTFIETIEEDEERKRRNDAWVTAYKRMAQDFTSLHCLHIRELIDEEAVGDSWPKQAAQYLAFFGPSRYAGNLRCVEVSILGVEDFFFDPSYWICYATVLEEASRVLQDKFKKKCVQKKKTKDTN